VSLRERRVSNVDRAVGALLSGEITRRLGPEGLPEESIGVVFRGSAGQSFGAWLAPGVSLTLRGEANDYVCKGMSGGVVAVMPPEDARFRGDESVVVGNVVLYGAPGSASPSATRVPAPSWRASATTAAST
jgi:glutamate synthase domain-containing protein 3